MVFKTPNGEIYCYAGQTRVGLQNLILFHLVHSSSAHKEYIFYFNTHVHLSTLIIQMFCKELMINFTPFP